MKRTAYTMDYTEGSHLALLFIVKEMIVTRPHNAPFRPIKRLMDSSIKALSALMRPFCRAFFVPPGTHLLKEILQNDLLPVLSNNLMFL